MTIKEVEFRKEMRQYEEAYEERLKRMEQMLNKLRRPN